MAHGWNGYGVDRSAWSVAFLAEVGSDAEVADGQIGMRPMRAATRIQPEDTVIGTPGDDKLRGTDDDDTLDGAAGADTLRGGLGADTYHVDQAGDVIVESANGGTDTVVSAIDCVLGTNLENLMLAGSAVNGTGNSKANALTGNALGNQLLGEDGADTLDGGDGNDTMEGGARTDVLYGRRALLRRRRGQRHTGGRCEWRQGLRGGG